MHSMQLQWYVIKTTGKWWMEAHPGGCHFDCPLSRGLYLLCRQQQSIRSCSFLSNLGLVVLKVAWDLAIVCFLSVAWILGLGKRRVHPAL